MKTAKNVIVLTTNPRTKVKTDSFLKRIVITILVNIGSTVSVKEVNTLFLNNSVPRVKFKLPYII